MHRVPGLFVVALTLLFAGCIDPKELFDEGPHTTMVVGTDSIKLYSTYGNYPANWTFWGHVTLQYDKHMIVDKSKGKSAGIQVHRFDQDDMWRHEQTYRFGFFGILNSLTFDEPGNYSISDIDRGDPGVGVHVNVTVLSVEQGCELSPVGWTCDYYRAPPTEIAPGKEEL